MSKEFFKNIFTQNPPSLYARSVEAARLAELFAAATELTGSLITVDNRQIPLQEFPGHAAEIAENVLSGLRRDCDRSLAPVIYKNLTAAFEALESRKACPEGIQETLSQIGAIATPSLAPKAA